MIQELNATEDLSQFVDGIYENIGLSFPSNAVSCFDEESSELTVNFIGKMMLYLYHPVLQ